MSLIVLPRFEKCFVCQRPINYNDMGSFFCDAGGKPSCFWGRDIEQPGNCAHFISVKWQDNKEDDERVICFDYQENRVSVYLDAVPSEELILPFIEASLENYYSLKIKIPKLLLL